MIILESRVNLPEVIDNNLNPVWKPQQLKQHTLGMETGARYAFGMNKRTFYAYLLVHRWRCRMSAKRTTCMKIHNHVWCTRCIVLLCLFIVSTITSTVKIDVYDFDDHTSHDMIGSFTATRNDLKAKVNNRAKVPKAQMVNT